MESYDRWAVLKDGEVYIVYPTMEQAANKARQFAWTQPTICWDYRPVYKEEYEKVHEEVAA